MLWSVAERHGSRRGGADGAGSGKLTPGGSGGWSSVGCGGGRSVRREGGEALEGGGEVAGPRPRAWKAQAGLAGVEAQAAGAVQQSVAQALGFAAREVAVEAQRLGVEDEVLVEQHELQPHGVDVEVTEREVLEP